MRKIEQVSKNRKDYIIKGNPNTSCDELFGKFLLTTIDPGHYVLNVPLENKILQTAFKDISLVIPYNNYERIIFGLELIFHGNNRFGVDVILGKLYSKEKEILDFIPFYVILYYIPLETFHGWYKYNYIPGQEVGIYIPTENNMVWEDRSAILGTHKELAKLTETILDEYFGKTFDNIIQNYIQEFPDLEDMTEEEAEFYNHALHVSFKLLRGQDIPEIVCDEEKIMKSINKIGS